MIVRELITKLGFNIDESKIRRFDKKIGDIKDKTEGITKNMKKMAQGIRNTGAIMTAAATVPIALLGKAMVDAASDAQESGAKFRVVFKDVGKQAETTADKLAHDFDIADSTARELLGSTGDLATGFGFTAEQALSLADRTNRLAGDLAAFQNIEGGAAEAGFKLTKGILGETENLKTLGIVVQQGSKAFKKRVKELMALKGLTEQQAKTETILEQAYTQSKNAIGAYARESKEYASQARALTENTKSLRESFGKILLPILNKLTTGLNRLVKALTRMPRWVKIIILAIGAFIAIIGPVLLIFGQLGLAVMGIMPLMTGFAAVTGITAGALLIIAAKILLVAAAIGLLFLIGEDIWVWFKGGSSALKDLVGWLDKLARKFNEIGNKKIFQLIEKVKSVGSKAINKTSDFFANQQTFGAGIPLGANVGSVNKSNSVTKQLNMKTDVKLEVPQGTTPEQIAAVENASKKIFRKEMANEATTLMNSNPKPEG